MSQRRKTRTKSTEIFSARHASKSRHIRLGIAAEAARIIATEGQSNYHAAKRKAAERIGASERILPSNREVQEALRDYQSLYGGEAHARNLEQLRTIAVESMKLLADFSPRLVGPVLDGTARSHSRISLHVFSEAFENLVLFFIDRKIPFDQEERRIRWHGGEFRQVPVLVIERGETPIEMAVLSNLDLRQAPPSPIDGKPQQRATREEVELLIAETENSSGIPLLAQMF